MSKYEETSLTAGYCEYMTPAETTAKSIAAKIFIIAFSVILSAAMLFVTLKTIPVVSFMLLAAIIFMTWFIFQFTKAEYEYSVAGGIFTLSKIYGERTRKDILEFKMSDITLINPAENAPAEKLSKAEITCRKNADSRLFIAYSDGSEERYIVISAPTKTISCLKFYKRSAFSHMQ